MGGMTTHGFPFPTGSDRVMDGDNAIQALAEKIDAELVKRPHVEYGQITVPALSSGQSTTTAVVFPVPFTSLPSVTTGTGNGRVGMALTLITLTGFNIVSTNAGAGGSGTHTSWWIAAGDRQTAAATTQPADGEDAVAEDDVLASNVEE